MKLRETVDAVYRADSRRVFATVVRKNARQIHGLTTDKES
jgi:hypothetical protein